MSEINPACCGEKGCGMAEKCGSETPLFAGVGTAPNLSLETALAESRAELQISKRAGEITYESFQKEVQRRIAAEAECERLRNQWLEACDEIIAQGHRAQAAESREREAYKRAAKVCRNYSNWLKEHHCAADRNDVADYLADEISALADERRNDEI